MSGRMDAPVFQIVGAGLAGLSCALKLAENGYACNLISTAPSERAQSVLAEGGVNAALNTMGEDDSEALHFEDTMKAGAYLADADAVRGLTAAAPAIVRRLYALGTPFQAENGVIVQRYFGGQQKRRAAFAGAATGKAMMSALIDEARKYEELGLIVRYDRHAFSRLLLTDDARDAGKRRCVGVRIKDVYTGDAIDCYGVVLLAVGGLNGLFPDRTTGSCFNTGDAQATLFAQGVRFSNLEMIQYHPTTVGIAGKRLLVTEAARGEGARLFVDRNGARWYFMEELYPAQGNLAPRDVVTREIDRVLKDKECGDQVYLDMTALAPSVWDERLAELREELLHYLDLDPAKESIPVAPGIHYFMGGVDVDRSHGTNIEGLFAAGECACAYHGANRLGGNSTLGALYGGEVAASQMIRTYEKERAQKEPRVVAEDAARNATDDENVSDAFTAKLGDALAGGLGVVREEATLMDALARIEALERDAANDAERRRAILARAMTLCAIERKESRGAHYRTDYPKTDDAYRKSATVCFEENGIRMAWKALP